MIVPFVSFAWSDFGGQYGQPFVRVLCDSPNVGRYAAQQLKARPNGKRMICFQNAETAGKLFWHPADKLPGGRKGLWWPSGIAATAAQFGAMIEQMFANGGDVDYAVFDIESGISSWTIDEADLAAIHADPRYAALVATGDFPADCRNMNAADRNLFNYGCGLLFDDAMKKAIIAPLYKRYANVNWSNFGDCPITKADAAMVPDTNGHQQYYAASSATYYSPYMYGIVGNLKNADARFAEPWYALAWTCNAVRAVYRAKADAKVMPWLAPRIQSNVLDVAHWQEIVFHACCLCGPGLLYFNADDLSALSNWRFDNALSQYVANARGKVWKQTLVTDLTQYTEATYILSAAKLADGSVVGRVTFKPGVDTATFTVDGKAYTATRSGTAVGAWFHS